MSANPPMSRSLSEAGAAEGGIAFGNRLLDALPADARMALRPHLRIEALAAQTVLVEPGSRVDQVYFPLDCIASLVTGMRDGGGVEVGLIGHDGMLPVSAVLGGGPAMQKAVVMIAGMTLAIKGDELRLLMKTHPLGRVLLCYAQAAFNQAAQLAACNRLHLLEERCARWLLMAHDRIQHSEIRITQEMLATALGVHRPGVTVAAQALQAKGLIAYRHGTVAVLNRKRLEAAACECYGSIMADYARLVGTPA